MVSSPRRFFQTKKYGLHSPRSRQNAVTVCPLRACSEISSRHFVQAFFVRRVVAQHCYTRSHPARCGSLIAHAILRTRLGFVVVRDVEVGCFPRVRAYATAADTRSPDCFIGASTIRATPMIPSAATANSNSP